jgi:hypothetical protein
MNIKLIAQLSAIVFAVIASGLGIIVMISQFSLFAFLFIVGFSILTGTFASYAGKIIFETWKEATTNARS